MTKNEAVLLFNINPFYTEEELRERWRFLVKQHHPDLGHNPEYFTRLLLAHETLREHRRNYSEKQEWFDYVSSENQREMFKNTYKENNISEPLYLCPFTGAALMMLIPVVTNNLFYMQQLFNIQLKLSATSGKLLHILFQNQMKW